MSESDPRARSVQRRELLRKLNEIVDQLRLAEDGHAPDGRLTSDLVNEAMETINAMRDLLPPPTARPLT